MYDCIQEQAKLNADWIFLLSLLIIENEEACVLLFFSGDEEEKIK